METKTLIIDGVEYLLIPKSAVQPQIVSSIPPDEIILSGYQVEESNTSPGFDLDVEELPEDMEVEEAVGESSEHRKKFLEHRIDMNDINKGRGVPIDKIRQFKDTNDINQASYKGEKLFFGGGLEVG